MGVWNCPGGNMGHGLVARHRGDECDRRSSAGTAALEP